VDNFLASLGLSVWIFYFGWSVFSIQHGY